MPESRDEFLKRLLSTFQVEAEEHIGAIASGLRDLAGEIPSDRRREVLEMIFREAHSLKGAARAVSRPAIETICQAMESAFSALKRGETEPSGELMGLLQDGADALAGHLPSLETGAGAELDAREYRARVETLLAGRLPPPPAGATPPSPPPEGEERTAMSDTVRIPAFRLNAILLQAEELLSAKISASERAAELRGILSDLASWKKEWARTLPGGRGGSEAAATAHPPADRQEGGLPAFLEWSRSYAETLESRLASQAAAVEQLSRSLGGMVDDLLEETKKALMLPCGRLLEIFPRFVRDLSREQGKEVEFTVSGEDVEMDRRILEEMKDPLLHMLRNAVDHGIEVPAARVKNGKPRRGAITIAIRAKEGNRAEIEISDDGAGIDLDAVRISAQRAGPAGPGEAEDLGEEELLSHIFRSGVSTSRIVTDISGRGLGLAIVLEKVEKVGGSVSVRTRRGAGTAFRIVLPVAFSKFRAVLVRAGGHPFAIPAASVERASRVRRNEIRTVEGRETIPVDGQPVALSRLAAVLGIAPAGPADDPGEHVHVVALVHADKRIAFLVDEVISEGDVLVKSLGPQLARVRNFAGASMLGTGKIVPVLHVPDLIQSAVRASGRAPALAASPAAEGRRRSALVVEDSITSRTLIRNILESAGFDVRTAVDGVDGLTQLKSGRFDVVVSDVDMPRMNGFELTAKIRADKNLATLPVVLVTALETREDRERGIDVGANAYIVKSRFHESDLVDVVRRLV